MESEDNVGLSDIIDVLNTIDNNRSSPPEPNDAPSTAAPSPPFIGCEIPTNQQLSHSKYHNPQPTIQPAINTGTSNTTSSKKHKPYIKIIEQPDGELVRFRYKCEGRSAGSIPGVNSTPEKKTYPTIEIVGYKGEVVIVVSCVTKDPPYRPHPHNLVGKEGCKNGICTLVLNGEPLRAVFTNLGIQCVKRNDVKKALDEREELKVDPFKTKFAHKDQPSSIDLNAVRLCFQAFLKTPEGVKILTPVVTDPIYDKKTISGLVISRLCSCSAKVSGGDEIILLCDRVSKDDIKIRFYELGADDRVIWEDFAEFQQTDIHKQTAIAFKTPRYHTTEITDKAKVFIQLLRPSDGATSKPLPFEFYPDPGMRTFPQLRRKLRRKRDLEIFQQILSVDSVINVTKYPGPESERNTDIKDADGSNTSSSSEALCHSNPFTYNTPNEYKDIRKQRGEDYADGDGCAVAAGIGGSVDQVNKVQAESDTLFHVYSSTSNKGTQTSTPTAEIQQQQLNYLHPISACDKIKEWMRSSEFERTESLNVENGDSVSVTPVTVCTNITNTSSSLNATIVAGIDDDFNELPERVADKTMVSTEVRHEGTTIRTNVEETAQDTVVPAETSTSTQASVDVDENFDDITTYNSLRLALKHPVDIPLTVLDYREPSLSSNPSISLTASNTTGAEEGSTELVVLINPPAPKIQVNIAPPLPSSPPEPPLRTPSPLPPDHILPPLPPKPMRSPPKIALNTDHCSSDALLSTESNARDNRNDSIRPPSQIIIMRTPDHSPNRSQPNTPSKKKQGFFTRFFPSRKGKTNVSTTGRKPNDQSSKPPSNASSRESSIGNFSLLDANRASTRSIKSNASGLSPQNGSDNGSPSNRSGQRVARSSSIASGKRSTNADADVIHIPLKGGDSIYSLSPSSAGAITLTNHIDRRTLSALQLADIPITDGKMELVAIADRQSIKNLCEGAFNVKLDPGVDLSEAEHFALYTSIPANGEESLGYMEQVEAGLILTADDIAKRLAEANRIQ